MIVVLEVRQLVGADGGRLVVLEPLEERFGEDHGRHTQ